MKLSNSMVFFLSLLGLVTLSTVQALVCGDIAIVHMISMDPDEIEFVTLVDLPAGEIITFTDNGWLSTGGFPQYNFYDDHHVNYTTTSAVSAGTVMKLQNWPKTLSFRGDQVIAYSGAKTSPTILFGFNYHGTNWSTTASDRNTSAEPPCTGGTVAMSSYQRVWAYSGTRSGSRVGLLAALTTPSNWAGQSTQRPTLSNVNIIQSFTITSTAVTGTSGTFSEESSTQGVCPVTGGVQTGLSGLTCTGNFCDNLQMTCYNGGSTTFNSTKTTSGVFSEETTVNGTQGLGSCPGSNEVITGISCSGSYCDNLNLTCQGLASATLDTSNCGVTSTFPTTLNQTATGTVPTGAYAVAVGCVNSYCGQKYLRYCYPSSTTGFVTTSTFSEEGTARGDCPVSGGFQTSLSGLSCGGDFCDNMQMTCYTDSSTVINSSPNYTSVEFSEESGVSGLGSCPGSNQVVTGIACSGSYCDNLKLTCKQLATVTLNTNNCTEITTFPTTLNQTSSGTIPTGAYTVGIRCLSAYCGQKKLKYCYPNSATTTSAPTKSPTPAPTPAPTPSPVATGGPVSYAVGPFSDESNNNTGTCASFSGLQTFMTGLSCSGLDCDVLNMICSNYGNDTLADDAKEGAKFSDENNELGVCNPSMTNAVITKLRCQNTRCDNMFLTCRTLTSSTLNTNNCTETPEFASTALTTGSGVIPSGSYPVGLRCGGSHCGTKKIKYCYPLKTTPAPTPAPTKAPTNAPTPAPTLSAVSYVVGPFSDESNNNTGTCAATGGLQTHFTGLTCNGVNCDDLTMICSNNGATTFADDPTEGTKFSDEGNGQGVCKPSMNNAVITKIRCSGLYCDNKYLTCRTLTSATLDTNNCTETLPITSSALTSGSVVIPSGSFATEMKCTGSYCSTLSIKYCFTTSSRRLTTRYIRGQSY